MTQDKSRLKSRRKEWVLVQRNIATGSEDQTWSHLDMNHLPTANVSRDFTLSLSVQAPPAEATEGTEQE